MAAVTKSGGLFLWGDNKLGTLGIKEASGDDFVQSPTAVSTLEEKHQRIESVSCGRSVTFAVSSEGALWGWGFGKHNVLLEGDSSEDGTSMIKANTVKRVPFLMKSFQPIMSVSSGINHVAAVTRTRELITWGSSDCGKLGHPMPAEQSDSGPAKIKIPGTVVQATCGATFTVVLTAR